MGNRAMVSHMILERIIRDFPGLIDGISEVSGSELVMHMTNLLDNFYPKGNTDGT